MCRHHRGGYKLSWRRTASRKVKERKGMTFNSVEFITGFVLSCLFVILLHHCILFDHSHCLCIHHELVLVVIVHQWFGAWSQVQWLAIKCSRSPTTDVSRHAPTHPQKPLPHGKLITSCTWLYDLDVINLLLFLHIISLLYLCLCPTYCGYSCYVSCVFVHLPMCACVHQHIVKTIRWKLSDGFSPSLQHWYILGQRHTVLDVSRQVASFYFY